MKKWGILLLILAGLCLLVIEQPGFLKGTKTIHIHQEKLVSAGNEETIAVTGAEVFKGDLLLVNDQNPVRQEGMRTDLVPLAERNELTQGYGLMDRNIQLSEEIALKFSEMVSAAEEDGVDGFVITSGFRDLQEQDVLYQEKGADYALPSGYSEHHLGLSLDVGSTRGKMSETSEGEWIEKHAWEYGFILRYPEHKTEITKIRYEPWHIRYVGLPHSAIMHKKDLVLEEYIDYLKSEGSISLSFEGQEYKVSYLPLSLEGEISVPSHGNYELSGNNVDGVILTEFIN